MGTEDGQAGRYCTPGQNPQAGMVLSHNTVTACILLSGHDFPCIVRTKHLLLCTESEWRESVLGLGDNGGLIVK